MSPSWADEPLSGVEPDCVDLFGEALPAPGIGPSLRSPVSLLTTCEEAQIVVVEGAEQKGKIKQMIHWPSFCLGEIVSGS